MAYPKQGHSDPARVLVMACEVQLMEVGGLKPRGVRLALRVSFAVLPSRHKLPPSGCILFGEHNVHADDILEQPQVVLLAVCDRCYMLAWQQA